MAAACGGDLDDDLCDVPPLAASQTYTQVEGSQSVVALEYHHYLSTKAAMPRLMSQTAIFWPSFSIPGDVHEQLNCVAVDVARVA